MNRKHASLLAPFLIAASSVSHANGHHGCNFETLNFSDTAGELFSQTTVDATTALTTYELFGFSSDDCDTEITTSATFQRSVYVAHNLDSIEQNIAQGNGAHLESLATLMQMPENDAQHFFTIAKLNYDNLFGSSTTGYSEWLDRLDATLEADAQLAKYSLRSSG